MLKDFYDLNWIQFTVYVLNVTIMKNYTINMCYE